MRRAIIIAAIILVASPALGFYIYRDGNNVLQTFFDFTCNPPGAPVGGAHCSAQVIIDSTGTEKGTPANPVVSATIGATNVTPTDCSGTITSGGTAQTIIAASPTIHGFSIGNVDAVTGSGEPLCISFSGNAACGNAGSWPLGAPTATTLTGMGTYTTPVGFGANAGVSAVAATTGHVYSCTRW